jgi:hypothetical protein
MLIQLLGPPASGKSFSFRNLNPKTTVIIDTDNKSGPYAGFRKEWNKEAKNYIVEKNLEKIKSYMLGIVKSMPDVNCIIVDTMNSILSEFLHGERSKSGFDKFKALGDMGFEFFSFVRANIPNNIIVVVTNHTESYKKINENYMEETWTRALYPGAMLSKMNLASFLSYNLIYFYDPEEPILENRYKIRTVTNGRDEVRSVYGVLPEVMPNNLAKVISLIRIEDLCIDPPATVASV